jgi:peptidoglycan-associated lipoprotein
MAHGRWLAFRVAGLLLVLTSGCAYTLHNPYTWEEVRCGTIPMPSWWTYTQARDRAFGELECIETAAVAARPTSPVRPGEKPPAPAVPPESGAPAPAPTPPTPPEPAPPPAPDSSGAAEPPATAAARPDIEGFEPSRALRDIFFEFDDAEVSAEGARVLEANAAWLRDNPSVGVLIEGHCDERGTNEYNLALGQHRARATADYLIAQGVESARITVVSYGEERPFCTERTEECWSQNRRSHFLIRRKSS